MTTLSPETLKMYGHFLTYFEEDEDLDNERIWTEILTNENWLAPLDFEKVRSIRELERHGFLEVLDLDQADRGWEVANAFIDVLPKVKSALKKGLDVEFLNDFDAGDGLLLTISFDPKEVEIKEE